MSRKPESNQTNGSVADPAGSSLGAATSAKIMNTRIAGYIDNPQRVYLQLKCYIDDMANYKMTRTKLDLDPSEIKSRTIQLAIPESTSPEQWLQLFRAIRYGKKRGVSLVVTKIRD